MCTMVYVNYSHQHRAASVCCTLHTLAGNDNTRVAFLKFYELAVMTCQTGLCRNKMDLQCPVIKLQVVPGPHDSRVSNKQFLVLFSQNSELLRNLSIRPVL